MLSTINVQSCLRRDILAGSLVAESDFKLIAELADHPYLVLDFADVEVVTPSHFRVGFWPLISSRTPRPLLANVPDDSADDLELFLNAQDLGGVWFVTLVNGAVTKAWPRGVRERPLLDTLEAFEEFGELTAGQIRQYDASIRSTAWSNRLAGLYEHGLLCRRKVGRKFFYRRPWDSVGEQHNGR